MLVKTAFWVRLSAIVAHVWNAIMQAHVWEALIVQWLCFELIYTGCPACESGHAHCEHMAQQSCFWSRDTTCICLKVVSSILDIQSISGHPAHADHMVEKTVTKWLSAVTAASNFM